jgi:nucleoside-diphosphate-sugar epimerase
MNILITGGNGYIAKSLSDSLGKEINRDNITSISRLDFDLTSREATNKWFKNQYFDVVIHTAISGGSRLEKDDGNVFYQNIQMFYNLLSNKNHFTKLIHFGSGAELGMTDSPYGLSKNIINKIAIHEQNFYNIRIYGVFDENELDTRFIKSSIKRYINKQPIEIHQNKQMDFIYMKDLITLVKYCIKNTTLPKIIEGSYKKKHTLSDIAKLINQLSDYSVPVKVHNKGLALPYIGNMIPPIKLMGLKKGIKEVYSKLK